MRFRSTIWLLTASFSVIAGCTAQEPAEPDVSSSASKTSSATRATYGDLASTLPSADYGHWLDARDALVRGFDDICGDTFCSGDYSNLRTVLLDCAATHTTNALQGCTWVLAGSIDYVDGATGVLSTDARIFACPIAVSGKAKPFLAALGASTNPLREALPGVGKSFYDALGVCLAGVVGHAPPASTGVAFAELSEHLRATSDSDARAWRATERALDDAFDDICGDTFCEGDYGAIEPLGISCAFDAVSGNVTTCRWTFGMAETSVSSRGKMSVHSETRSCDFAVNAKPAALIGVTLDDPLPGTSSSIYDALVDCL